MRLVRLVIWQAGAGGHGNGARCVGARGSARVVVVCRSGAGPGLMVITVIGGHLDKVGGTAAAFSQRATGRGRTDKPSQAKIWQDKGDGVVLFLDGSLTAAACYKFGDGASKTEEWEGGREKGS
jgi:hypothetical protein